MTSPKLPRAGHGRSLIRSYLVLSALVTVIMIVALDAATAWLVSREMLVKEQELAAQLGHFLHGQLLEHQPASGEGASPEDWNRTFEFVLDRTREDVDFERVNVIGGDGLILFSSHPESVGSRLPKARLDEILRESGTTDLLEVGAKTDGGDTVPAALIESYVPVGGIDLPGRAGAPLVVEVYRSAAGYLEELTRSRSIARGIAFVSCTLMFLAQLWIVLAGKRTIDQRTRELEALSSSLELQVERRTQELITTRRLADVGRLAAGVAHEINTPLASIAACAEGLLDDARPEDQDYLRIIRHEAFRVKGITRSLLDFGRTRVTRKDADLPARDIELEGVFADLVTLFQHEAKARGVELRARVEPASLGVRAREELLRQILLNVTRNALDATAAGGSVTWSARRHGDDVRLECRDDGEGIPAELLDQILDPFVTTKDPGKGSGLGLATATAAAAQLGGRLRVSSEGENRGAVVTLELPT